MPNKPTKPLIGLTPNVIVHEPWAPIQYGQNSTYTDAIIAAGGLPVILPLTSDDKILVQLYERLDGLVLCGGEDLDPANLRDQVETTLLRRALADDLPVLATCRGMQLLNAVLGGSLHQDIGAEISGTLDHNNSRHAQDIAHIANQIQIIPDSLLGRTLGTSIGINEYHHQAVKDLGTGLKVTAKTADGVIEGIEWPAKKFCVGVQCHPESLAPKSEPRWAKLFQTFVIAAKAK